MGWINKNYKQKTAQETRCVITTGNIKQARSSWHKAAGFSDAGIQWRTAGAILSMKVILLPTTEIDIVNPLGIYPDR